MFNWKSSILSFIYNLNNKNNTIIANPIDLDKFSDRAAFGRWVDADVVDVGFGVDIFLVVGFNVVVVEWSMVGAVRFWLENFFVDNDDGLVFVLLAIVVLNVVSFDGLVLLLFLFTSFGFESIVRIVVMVINSSNVMVVIEINLAIIV